MRLCEPVYLIYNTMSGEVEESSENCLPLIFGDKIEAEDVLAQFNCRSHLCVVEATMVQNDALIINFKCPECKIEQLMDGALEEILYNFKIAGWPICSECGSDMNFSIEE